MAAQVEATYYILVKFDSPDCNTYCGLKNYNILVIFDHPDGSTLTIQMAAQAKVTYVIIF